MSSTCSDFFLRVFGLNISIHRFRRISIVEILGPRLGGFPRGCGQFSIMEKQGTPIGRALRAARQEQRIKLTAVSRVVAPSTIHAIERGRMIPSVSVLDAITEGLGLPRGALDVACLESSCNMRQRAELVDRIILTGKVPRLRLQRLLRHAARADYLSSKQQRHTQFLVAKVLGETGHTRRAIVIAEHLARETSYHGLQRVEILGLLGRCYLQEGNPQAAIGPLREAIGNTTHSDVWEGVVCNLGLAFWQIGAYDRAETQWQHAIRRVTNPIRLANAHMGMGNLEYRRDRLRYAIKHYEKAYSLYTSVDANPTLICKILNNMLKCMVRQKFWESATSVASALANRTCEDPVTQGEFLATQAEWACTIGLEDNARQLIGRAKELLGSSLVSSWFSARVLELAMATSIESREALETDLELALTKLNDRQLAVAIRIRIARNMLYDNNTRGATESLKALAALFPAID